MNKQILIGILFLLINSQGLTLAEIKAAMALQAPMSMDSVWLEIEQKMQIQTQVVQQKIKMVSLGKNWMRMEMVGPMGKQFIIRQPDKLLTKSGENGKVLIQKLAPDTVISNGVPNLKMDINENDYMEPLADGNLWKLVSKHSMGLEKLEHRTLWYDPHSVRIVKIWDQYMDGNESKTQIEYCKTQCAFANTPSKMTIESKSMGQSILLEMNFVQFRKVKSLADGYFDLK